MKRFYIFCICVLKRYSINLPTDIIILISGIIFDLQIKVSCGRYITIIQNNKKTHIFGPIRQYYLSKCDNIEAIGYGHDYFVTASSNKIFVWKTNSYHPPGSEYLYFMEDLPTTYTLPTRSKVKLVRCGYSHTIILTENGECYGLGNNRSGQLGLGKYFYSEINLPEKIPLNNVTTIYCGEYHTLALTTNGKCYSWGKNKVGQLGIGTFENKSTPQELNLSHVISINCGFYHSIALTLDTCWIWGHNQSGQLGLADFVNRSSPHKLIVCENDPITVVYSSSDYTIVLTSKRSLFAWGGYKYDELGHRIIPNVCISIPQKIDLKIPIKSIHCSTYRSVIVTSTNKIYFWDKGEMGFGTGLAKIKLES